jgi:hypothetical protein
MSTSRAAEAFRPSGFEQRIGANLIGVEVLTERFKVQMIEKHAYTSCE